MKKFILISILLFTQNRILLSSEVKEKAEEEYLNVDKNSSDFQKKVRIYKGFNENDLQSLLIENLKKENFVECVALLEAGATFNFRIFFKLIEDNEITEAATKLILSKLNCKPSFDQLANDKTLLMLFATQNKENVAKLIVSQGAYAHAINSEGRSAVYYAFQNGNNDLADFLASQPKIEPKKNETLKRSCIIS